MNEKNRTQEINEARAAGCEALNCLKQAQDKLFSARSWGVWDMIGGGLVSTMIKHSRMDDASELMEEARQKLRIFQRELQDVYIPAEFNLEIGGFLELADYFFDNIVTDWVVQSKIEEAKTQVGEAVREVEAILERLSELEHVIDTQWKEV